MSKKQKNETSAKAPVKLTRAEKKEIQAVIRKYKGDGKPHSAQASIPYEAMYQDGVCRVTPRTFSKCIEFTDISYQLAQADTKTAIFENLCDLYNYLDASIHVQFSFINRKIDPKQYAKSFEIRAQGDDFDDIRSEYSGILQDQLVNGNNGLMKRKFMTYTIEADSLKMARARLRRIETDLLGYFKSMGASAWGLDAKERLEVMHSIFHPDGEPLTGDRLDGFLEATEQANAIPQPQAWNGIDGLLNGKPFMPEASPADQAAALIELAEKNAPRLGSEERQLIVAYAEAVGDNDKVIGLINRLCEQGYELEKGQMDSFVKSEIESEIAVANAQRQIAQNPAAEPVVTILWSESPHLKDGQQMPLHEAEAVFKELDSARRHEREQPGYTGHWYDKTKFRIDFTMQGQPDSYEGRQDFGDGDGSLIQHIRAYHEYYAQDESWKNHVLHHEGPEAWEADKAQRDMLLHEFVPYMELHCNLAAMEQEARRPLRSGETLTPEQTAYFYAVLDYVKECRPLLNQDQYHLPEPPQLADFDQSLQDYKKQIEAELEQEAAAAGLTMEEYVASDYEAPAQPNFSIYQVPPGPEGRDFRYRSYEDLQADGLSVDRKNYQLVYTAPLDKDTTLDEIYRRFNMEYPADYKGHSLSMGDIVVFRQDGKQTAYYVDEGADYRQVPEFFAQPEKQLTPDECMTGEQIQTPRGRFYLTDRSREQMEAAGYGFHHQSEDGRYLIMANGTRAFAIPAQSESHIKTAEMSTEQNYNMIDGMMNNAPSMEELEARAKAGEQISLLDVAEAAKAEAKKPKQTRKTTQKQKKPSIRAQLAAAKEEQKKKPPVREKSKEMEV